MPQDLINRAISLTNNSHFAIVSWDGLIILFLLALSVVYTFFISHGKVLSILVATYMAFVLVDFAPFLTPDTLVLKLLVFAILFLLIMFFLLPVIFQSPVGTETFGWVSSFLLSFAQTGFLVAVIVSFLPGTITQEFSDLTLNLFVRNHALFYWALAPIVLLLFLGRKANKEIG